MKTIQLVHALLTGLLIVGVTVFAVLWFAGIIEVRRRSSDSVPETRRPTEAGGAKARLLVLHGLRPNWEYTIYEGINILGRADEKPVDIDLQPQEPEDRIWSSRQHAAITCKGGALVIEDLSSSNGTYVNRNRVPPGEKRPLQDGRANASKSTPIVASRLIRTSERP